MMRIQFAVATALLLASSAVAGAQFPGRGSSVGVGRSPTSDDPAMKKIGPELELRLANGVNIIIAHAKDLSLTSDQLSRIALIKRRLDSLNTPLMRQLEYLERINHEADVPHSRGDLPDPPNPALDHTLDSLHTNLRGAEADAYEELNGTQLQRALQMIKEARTNAALAVGKDRRP
jgi:hypothetical protein